MCERRVDTIFLALLSDVVDLSTFADLCIFASFVSLKGVNDGTRTHND